MASPHVPPADRPERPPVAKERGAVSQTLYGQRIDGASWSAEGDRIVTSCLHVCTEADEVPLMVWDLHEAQLAWVVEHGGGAGRGGHAAFSPGARYVGVGTHDRIRVWRVEDGEPIMDDGAIATYGNFAFGPAGRRVIWGNVFGLVKLFDLEGRRVVREAAMHEGAASLGVGFAWRGGVVSIATEHLGVARWSGETGADVGPQPSPPPEPPGGLDGLWWTETDDRRVRAVAHPNGFIAVQTGDQPYRVLRRATGPRTADAMAMDIDLSPDGRHLALGEARGAVELWDLVRERGTTIIEDHPHAYRMTRVTFSPDGRHLVVVAEGEVVLYDVAEGASRTLEDPDRTDETTYMLQGWTADGTMLMLTVDRRLFGVDLGAHRAWSVSLDERAEVRLSPDRRILAIAGPDLTLLRLADRATVRLVAAREEGRLVGKSPVSGAELRAFLEGP